MNNTFLIRQGEDLLNTYQERTWREWKACFKARSSRGLPEIDSPMLAESAKRHLARSLAVFQAGESGEGRLAFEIYRFHAYSIDHDYRKTIGYFVAEEGRHGRILIRLVRSLGGERLINPWSERLFTFGRRMMWTHFKLLVLMAAEVAGISFYSLELASTHLSPQGWRRALFNLLSMKYAMTRRITLNFIVIFSALKFNTLATG